MFTGMEGGSLPSNTAVPSSTLLLGVLYDVIGASYLICVYKSLVLLIIKFRSTSGQSVASP